MENRLLIADGDPELSDLYQRFFSRNGYEVETAGGGLECLDKLRSRQHKYVILDLGIPWGGGDGVLACLREEFPLRSHPHVVVTSNPYFEAGPEQDQHPVVGRFQKPCRLTALLDCIRSVAG